MKLLISAFDCAPHMGSEQGRAWNLVTRLAVKHQVWVVCNPHSRAEIEAWQAQQDLPNLRFIYLELDLLHWLARRFQRVPVLFPVLWNTYYYLWQLLLYPLALCLQRELSFDVTHHIGYTRFWMPSLLALLPVPFVWGTVGGAEQIPPALWASLGWRGQLEEGLRQLGQALAYADPLVRITARRSRVALAMTAASRAALQRLGAPNIVMAIDSGMGLDLDGLVSSQPAQHDWAKPPFRFISVGRLVAWKGYHLSLQAFACLQDLDVEYWLVGEGSQLPHLQALAQRLGLEGRVRFTGQLPRKQVLDVMQEAHVFMHPALHESGGTVVLEALSSCLPVICCDVGGPAVMVDETCGIIVPAEFAAAQDDVIDGLAAAMRRLAENPALAHGLGKNGPARAAMYNWDDAAAQYDEIYSSLHNPTKG